MGSIIKNNYEMLCAFFSNLEESDIYIHPKALKKLAKHLEKDIDDFLQKVMILFLLKDFSLNKFEILKLTESQKRKIDGNKLYRFEYRKRTNLRMLFVLINDYSNTIIILDAFNENENKSNGKNSYDKAIDNAIKNYCDYKEDNYE